MAGRGIEATSLLVLLTTLAILLLLLARAGRRGRLRRNHLVGIRLSTTLRTDEAWREAHRAAAPALRAGGLSALFGVVIGAVALAGFSEPAVTRIACLAGFAVAFILVIRAGIVGNRAAARLAGRRT